MTMYKTVWKPKEYLPWKVDIGLVYEKVQESIDKKNCFGVVNYEQEYDGREASEMGVPIERIALLYTSAVLLEDGIELEYKCLETPMGRVLRQLHDAATGMEHNITMRGSLNAAGKVLDIDNFICFTLTPPERPTDTITVVEQP